MTVKIYLQVIWELIWYPLVNRVAYQLLTLSGCYGESLGRGKRREYSPLHPDTDREPEN